MPVSYKKNSSLLVIFLIVTGLIIYRGPCFLTEGIFEINEYQFYKYAKENGIIKGLFFVYEGAYYFKFWTNIANTFASLFSFEKAKLVTTYFSVAAYYIIFAYILFFNSSLLVKYEHKIFAIFVILLSPGMTPEIWMGSAHTREYFGIFAFILLFCDSKNNNNVKKIITNLLIIISFLSSVWAIVLSPVYLIKYYFNKNLDNFIFFLSSLFGSLTQFFIIINFYFVDSVGTSRFQIETEKILSFIYNVPVRSFFGSTIPKLLLSENYIISFKYFNFIIIFFFAVLFFLILIYLIKKNDFTLNLIFLSFILVSIFSLIGSLYSNFAGGRYAVVSSVILIFFVFRIFVLENNLILKSFSGFLIISSLIVGIIEFKYKSPLPQLLTCKYHEIQNNN